MQIETLRVQLETAASASAKRDAALREVSAGRCDRASRAVFVVASHALPPAPVQALQRAASAERTLEDREKQMALLRSELERATNTNALAQVTRRGWERVRESAHRAKATTHTHAEHEPALTHPRRGL